MEKDLLTAIVGLAWLANLVAWSGGPLQWIKTAVGLDCDRSFETKPGRLYRLFYIPIVQLFNCEKCSGFWIGFVYAVTTGAGGAWEILIVSSAVSIVAYGLGFVRVLPVPMSPNKPRE